MSSQHNDISGVLLNPLKVIRVNGKLTKTEDALKCDLYHNGYLDLKGGVWQVAIRDIYYKINESKIANAHKLYFEVTSNFVNGFTSTNEAQNVSLQVLELDHWKEMQGLIKFDILWFNVSLARSTIELRFKTFTDVFQSPTPPKNPRVEFDYEIDVMVWLLFKRVL